MSVTDRKVSVQPCVFGLFYKVVESKKICNGYYEDWYHYTKTLHLSFESAEKSASNLK